MNNADTNNNVANFKIDKSKREATKKLRASFGSFRDSIAMCFIKSKESYNHLRLLEYLSKANRDFNRDLEKCQEYLDRYGR